jgi:pyruvate formate lyase activating enzyme
MGGGNIKGLVFDIQRFSIHDGPGIRTNVFMKGCPLDCIWCHNPESLDGKAEIGYYKQKCLYCGACAVQCPGELHAVNQDGHVYSRAGCVRCGVCARACPAGALAVVGKEMTAAEVLREVKKDEAFYRNSGGGMTLSGGEPFYQPEFALALLSLAKGDGLHTCVETCGVASFDTLGKAAEYTDQFLYDVKETDPARHLEYTGLSNELILENLFRLDAAGAKIVLRCPIIPGLNDSEAHFLRICELAGRLKNVESIDVEPYHPLGVSKAEAIGKAARFTDASMPAKELVAQWADFIRSHASVPVYDS